LGERADQRGNEEDRDRRFQHDAAAIEIAELAEDQRRASAGQKIRRDDPGEILHAMKIGRDRG
jgi:hypothetical protein